MKLATDLNLAKLKVKAKSLAEEARIIRREESKFHGMDKWDLQNHRKYDVRNEARATQLAIAFLKGRNYLDVEYRGIRDWNTFQVLILPRVVTMVRKYGNDKKLSYDAVRNWVLRWIEQDVAA